MKKLSFIMAVLMILMCMPIMAMSSVSATEPVAEADPVVDLTIPDGCAVEENSIGYVLDNGEEVYVDTLSNAAAIAKANIGKQVILYLTKDYEASKTIGYGNANYAIMDLSGGANLVIDGQNHSILNTSTAASNPGRLFRFDSGDGTGILGFRNITLNTGDGKAGGCVEFGTNSLSFLSMKNVELVIPITNAYGFVIKCNAELDNVTRDCKSQNGLHLVGNNSVVIKNSTFSNPASAIVSDNSSLLGKIEVDGLTITNLTYNVFDKIKFQTGTDKGIFANNVTVTGKSNNGNALCDLITGDVTVYSAQVDKLSFVFDEIIGNVTVHDVTARNIQRFIYKLTGDIVVEDADVIMSAAFYRYFNGNIVIDGGDFVSTGDCIFYFDNGDASTITVNGGSFTVQLATKNIVNQLSDNKGKVLTINGGTFNSWNKDTEVNETTFASGKTGAISIIQSTGDTININGGIFNLYKDAGVTLATNGVHTVARGASNKINITGGTFNGGQYVNITGNGELASTKNAAMPEGKTTVTLNPTTTKGASVRTAEESSGIRFQGTVSKYAVDFLNTFHADKNVYCGVAIIPEAYLEKTKGVFTFAALEDADCIWATANADKGLVDNGDETYTVRLALTDIGNIDMKFVAISYVYVDTDADGKVTSADAVIYANEYSNARSIAETAKAALADVKNANEGKYTTAVTEYYYTKDGNEYSKVLVEGEPAMYSRYTSTQLAVLRRYA